MSAATIKAVSSEARSSTSSVCKSTSATLSALRDGAKQSSGVKKIPAVFTQNSHIEEALTHLDATSTSAQDIKKTQQALERQEKEAAQIVQRLNDTTKLLNVVWQKLLTPHTAVTAAA